jgi:hypothetical protein
VRTQFTKPEIHEAKIHEARLFEDARVVFGSLAGFHEAELLSKRYGVNQQPTWEELEKSSQAFRSLTEA